MEAIHCPVAELTSMSSMSSNQHWKRLIVLIGSGKQLVGYWYLRPIQPIKVFLYRVLSKIKYLVSYCWFPVCL